MGDYNSRYIRGGNEEEFLYDSDEIENFRQQQAQDVIDNNMLGDFNSDGHYIVDKSIINELITTTKVVTGVYDNFRFCESTKTFEGIGKIQFAVDFSSNPENGQAVAILILLESMKACNGYIDNTNGVSIARFVGNNDKNFVERALRYFYAFLPDEIDGAAHIENDRDIHFSNILARLSYLRSIKNLADPYINKIEMDTYKKKSKALNEREKGREVYTEFDEKKVSIGDKFMDKNSGDYYKLLNSLLDITIEKNNKKIKSDAILDNNLKGIDNQRRVNSKRTIDYCERETVNGNLSRNADVISERRTVNSRSRGTSPVAVYREPKKSYQEIEDNEHARYVVRDNMKSAAKTAGPRLFGNKNRYKEPENVTEDKDFSDKNYQEKGIPGRLNQKPSYLKNDRYEEIKNSEVNGEKLSTNPSPYSKYNKDAKVTNEFGENRQVADSQQKTQSREERDALVKDILNNKNKTEQKTVQKAPESERPQMPQNGDHKEMPQFNPYQQNTYARQQMMNPYQAFFNPYGVGPGNPYARFPGGMYGAGPRPQQQQGDDLEILDLIPSGPSSMPPPHGPVPPGPGGPMHGPGGPMGPGYNPPAPEKPGEEFGNHPGGPEIGIPKPVGPAIPVEEDGLGRIPGLESPFKPFVDATPIVNQEEVMKQIFGNDIYELTRENEEKQRQQAMYQQQGEDADENAFVYVHVKH